MFLPPEIWRHILAFLSITLLRPLRLVSHQWHKLIETFLCSAPILTNQTILATLLAERGYQNLHLYHFSYGAQKIPPVKVLHLSGSPVKEPVACEVLVLHKQKYLPPGSFFRLYLKKCFLKKLQHFARCSYLCLEKCIFLKTHTTLYAEHLQRLDLHFGPYHYRDRYTINFQDIPEIRLWDPPGKDESPNIRIHRSQKLYLNGDLIALGLQKLEMLYSETWEVFTIEAFFLDFRYFDPLPEEAQICHLYISPFSVTSYNEYFPAADPGIKNIYGEDLIFQTWPGFPFIEEQFLAHNLEKNV